MRTEKIRSWSYGEVKKPETINYRSFKPEKTDILCEDFRPDQGLGVQRGKYKRMKHAELSATSVGVEVISLKLPGAMGHIELAAPVAHIWFLKGVPSRIGTCRHEPQRAGADSLF